MEQQKKGIRWFIITAGVVLAISQLGSYLINTFAPQHQSIEVFPFLYITHIRNLGGIFGLLQGKGWLFTILSILVLTGLSFYILRTSGIRFFEYLCYGLIVGGGLSNIGDRLIYGSVIDFLDVRGIPSWYYIFNTADVMIHLGIWPLVIYSLWPRRGEENGEATAVAGD